MIVKVLLQAVIGIFEGVNDELVFVESVVLLLGIVEYEVVDEVNNMVGTII